MNLRIGVCTTVTSMTAIGGSSQTVHLLHSFYCSSIILKPVIFHRFGNQFFSKMFGSFLMKGRGKCKDDPIGNSLTPNKLASDAEEIVDKSTENGEEPAKKTINRSNVSIDVTKALLLLGFSTWSSLEPGKLKSNFNT